MITKTGPKLIEYNVRFGDPETQSLMMRLESDPVPALLACVKGGLETLKIRFKPQAALCVVMAAKGYPGEYEKGGAIHGLDNVSVMEDVKVFHAGTVDKGGQIIAAGGRVLGITALAATLEAARELAYQAVDRIDWPEGFCRRDIGAKAITKECI
jgi:phosphoribosylamine--glycine ligase